MYRFLLLVLVFQFSCDEQSNPYVGEIESEHLESLGYESRDVLVLNDIEFNSSPMTWDDLKDITFNLHKNEDLLE